MYRGVAVRQNGQAMRTALARPAPVQPPVICIAMYSTKRSTLILRAISMPTDTAGFRCPPAHVVAEAQHATADAQSTASHAWQR